MQVWHNGSLTPEQMNGIARTARREQAEELHRWLVAGADRVRAALSGVSKLVAHRRGGPQRKARA
ncbi:hypothetical protein SAMN05216241_10474 [Limimonas halophila]|uniref:Uncharacterized protein n=1 Tax=Limimonas halophila TaxID=1082479 RepID=A0A1G7QN48_9PROT|nr:hypothetical protein [Limimonas halophila]SDF99935.1 hypothetical protein SAMN05216241_10474 [Limimonas halophila]